MIELVCQESQLKFVYLVYRYASLLFLTYAPVTFGADCQPIDIPTSILDRKIILLGEIHGTNEAPAFAGELVCNLMASRGAAVLALELPLSSQVAVNAAMAERTEADASKLFDELPFWEAKFQDGRRSQAIKQLMMQLWQLHQKNDNVRLRLIDPDTNRPQAERDAMMGARLKAVSDEFPATPVVALMGNLHARKQKGTPWDSDFLPAASFLVGENFVSLNIKYDGGTAWNCDKSGCGIHPVSRSASSAQKNNPTVMISDRDPNYDGVFFVGVLTASPPLKLDPAAIDSGTGQR